ncbi:MAG: carbohydrate-binding domain-containing protein [Clostridia bacterium]|nr:carbohydrate-binding domain-containing protein [Clostridia bacterium]
MKKRLSVRVISMILAVVFLLAMLAGCSGSGTGGTSNYVNPDVTADVTYTFSSSSVTADTAAADTISGTSVIIDSPGTYAFTGECDNGSILVMDGSGDVTLILNGLDLSYSEGAPIKIEGASTNAVITLADGTENSLSDTDRDESKPKSALNADGTLTINGTGAFTVYGNNKNGIKADGDLIIEEVTLTVVSADNGICADGTLTVNSGVLNITSGGDGLKSSPDAVSDSTPGVITINGGDITVNAKGDAISADGELIINGGSFDIVTESGDSDSRKAFKSAGTLTVNGGTFNISSLDDAFHSDTYVYILGGNMTINTSDDAFHADTSLIIGTEGGRDDDINITVESSKEGLEGGTVYVYSGNIDIAASDDGINAAGDGSGTDTFNPGGGGGMGPGGMGGRGMRGDMSGEGFGATDSTVSGGFGESKGRGPRAMDGKMTEGTDGEFPGEPPEGFDGTMPEGADGEFPGEPPEGFDGKMPEGADGTMPDMNGGEGFTVPSSTGEDYAVYIYGGNITVNCGGDGIDSNGNIYVYGGTTLVYASEDGGNGAIDYGDINSSLIVTGGTLLAAGNAQMAQWPGASSTQKSIAVTLSSILGAGDDVTISDAGGNTVFQFEAVKQANHIVFTSGDLTSGTYTVSVNGSAVSTYEVN